MHKSIPNCRLLLSAAICLTTLACGSKYAASSTTESQTLIGINPRDFVADGDCGTRLASYVATLFDDTGAVGLQEAGVSTTSFMIASTPPMSCDESVVFSDVVSGHAYRAEIDGYTQSAAELESAVENSSAMLSKSTKSYIAPASTATCHGWTDSAGTPQPGYAYAYVTRTLSNCSQLGSEP